MKNIIPIIIGIVIIAGITMYSQNKKTERRTINYSVIEQDKTIVKKDITEIDENDVMTEKDYAEKYDDVIMDDEKKLDNKMIVKKYGDFITYENVDIAELNGNIVLDFSATWCPSCRTFKKNVEENLMNIPANLTLILVDYDTHKDLRKQYGVTQQHTFVQIDASGNIIKKWTGGNNLQSVVDKIN